ncbi:MAG TPA: 5-oxoprolinase subunit PxpB [Saprospiraceae bacterium]|nr:5-oxoprolinase subunit PxpB [Saprospiraceae bacterium]HND89267.1 5-oxoprolinase subunit PxpB [Saprospiraceae bacterium]HNG88714.1 5-oxoprolinase subunit PxpB [Saprospiraceae bacterium]
MRIFPLSESAVLIQIGRSADPAVSERVHALCSQLARLSFPGLLAVVPGIADVTVFFDCSAWPVSSCGTATVRRACRFLEEYLRDGAGTEVLEQGSLWHIPVCYGGGGGPDLEEMSRRLGLSPEEVVALHCSTEYRVQMIGFLPGFPYLGPLPEALRVARRATPRLRVEAGSVAIAAAQTGIYPQASPGGWQVIGHTSFVLFDASQSRPARLQAGDRVRFVQAGGSET